MKSAQTGLKPTNFCRCCDVELKPGENWPPSRQNRRNRICSPCHSRKTREWELKNRDRHLAGHRGRSQKHYATDHYVKKARERRRTGAREYSDAGFVYVLTNPAWPGLVKIGSAVSLRPRLTAYQTSSPHRDYVIEHSAAFNDRLLAERILHRRLRAHRKAGTEWFQIHPLDARNFLVQLSKQENQ
jgi:hypothetical protein